MDLFDGTDSSCISYRLIILPPNAARTHSSMHSGPKEGYLNIATPTLSFMKSPFNLKILILNFYQFLPWDKIFSHCITINFSKTEQKIV